MATAAKISIQIDAQTAALQKGFAEAKTAINGLGAGMSGAMASGMLKANVAIAAVQATLATLQGAIRAVMGAMDDMGKMDEFASRLGMSADALTVLGYAAEQTGSTQETLNASLQKMQNLIGEAAAGSSTATAAFAALGLSISELQNLTPDQQFAKIAEQIQQVGSNSERTKITLDIFGRSGGELTNMLALGAEGMNAYGAEAAAMGLLMGDARGAVEGAGDSINKMKRAWGAFVQQVAVLVAPALAAIAEGLATVVGWFNRLLGHATGANGPFTAYATESKKAAIVIDKSMKETVKSADKAAVKIKESWKDIAKPQDWTTPAVGAVTRGSAAGFSAVQEANRARQDAERRQSELTGWLARIYERQRQETLTIAPVNL